MNTINYTTLLKTCPKHEAMWHHAVTQDAIQLCEIVYEEVREEAGDRNAPEFKA